MDKVGGMKILLLTMNRCGSKIMQVFLHDYLKQLGPSLSILNKLGHEMPTGLDEFLLPHANVAGYRAFEQDDGFINFDYNKKNDAEEECFRRLREIVKPHSKNCVVRHKPAFREFENIDLMNEIIDAFDKVVVLKRTDNFERVVSHGIAAYFDAFSTRDIGYEKALEEGIKNPIEIDPAFFKRNYRWGHYFMNDYYKKYYEHKDVAEITFEKMITIKTSEEFCKELNLPPATFELRHDVFPKEFGDIKYNMVKNLDQLREIADTIK